jgi:hypothetical protein
VPLQSSGGEGTELRIYGNCALKFRKMSKITNKTMRDDRVKSIYNHLVDLEENGIEVFKLTPYQYRFVKENHRIDYYPTSGKYFDITLNKWGTLPAYKINTLFEDK